MALHDGIAIVKITVVRKCATRFFLLFLNFFFFLRIILYIYLNFLLYNRRATEKPLAVLEYNKGKAGIDLSDQMASYSNTLRKGLKWYRKLAIELLLGLSVVNAFTVYKAATNKNINIRTFRERIAKDLLNLTSPQPVSQSKHIIRKRVDENNKTIRRACALCYAEAKRKFSRKEARKNIKRTTTYCPQCPNTPQLCIDCFPKYAHLKN